MPRDFDGLQDQEDRMAPYPADRPGWCEAIDPDQLPTLPTRRATAGLPASDDLLGWSVLALTAPGLLLGALILAQAALHLI